MTAHIYRIAVDIFHSRSIFGRFKILKNNMARCSMFYGGVWEICCLSGCGVLLPTFFMSKSSVADLRRILSRIFEHQCHKDQTGQQLFVRVEQKNYTTTYFIPPGITLPSSAAKSPPPPSLPPRFLHAENLHNFKFSSI